MSNLKNYSLEELKVEIERRENMPEMRETTELEQEAFEYLNDLRESGSTNMFGARPYLIEDLDLDKDTAGKLLTTWMKIFNPYGEYEFIDANIQPINRK